MTQKMIESLTPDQEAQISVYADKWTQIGLMCGPADRAEAVKYATIAYQKAGLAPPDEFYFVRSPLEAVRKIRSLTKESATTIIGQQLYGNQDACWLSYYEYFWQVLGIEECNILEGLIGLAKHAGWWHAYDKFAVIQDRPMYIKQNEEGNLHCTDGPAVEYSDGMKVWCIEGHRLTEQIVMHPETLTLSQLHGETNGDVQAIMIDRFGWPRYLKEIKAKTLDYRKNEVENTEEALFETPNHGLRLMVTCPTGRVFVKGLPSDANVTTCEMAQRWLGSDVSGDKPKYNVIGRT